MAAPPFRVKALYEYSSPHEDDLSFPAGVIITVTDLEDDDWYGGEYVDDAGAKHEGIFPRNFVEKFEPQAPPRPTRTRTKRDNDPAPTPAPAPEPKALDPEIEHEPEPEPEPQARPEPEPEPAQTRAVPPPPIASPTSPKGPIVPIQAPAPAPAPAAVPAPAPAPAPSKQAEPAATSPPAAKPAPKAAGPPPVSSKPSSNAFKDRIAAFNKPAAAPVTPYKPAGSGFVKKPFVAPPPSRNAYVPPVQQAPQAKLYRREEDPDIKEQEAEAQDIAEKAGFHPGAPDAEGDEEDQPKPTSLKERIALLQKQQMEQAQRHAEASSKKKEAKRPPKKRTDSHEPSEAAGEPVTTPYAVPHADPDTDEPDHKTSAELERLPPPPRRKSSKGPTPEPYHDGNEADMSGAGDTTEGQEDLTEREEPEERPRRMSRVPTSGPPPEPRKSIDRAEPQQEAEDEEEAGQEEDEEEDDEEAAEYRRKEELRQRMMKMSGGMGMGHMFGAPPPPSAPPKKKSTGPKRTSIDEARDEPTSPISSAPPVPVPGMGMMALPGMGAPRHTEEPEEVDEPVAAKSPTSPRAPPPPPARPVDDYIGEEHEEDEGPPVAPKRTSTDRAAPPPIPTGRPVPPPVPSESRPVPAPPPADAPESEGSESDDDTPGDVLSSSKVTESEARSPPPLPPITSRAPPPVPPTGEEPPLSPTGPTKRNSMRAPPPIPGIAPMLPPAAPGQARPPPPPPPGGPLSRQSTHDGSAPPLPPTRPPVAGENEDDEVTEYEGDYDTDIASSVPHKDALKSHARESSLEDSSSLKSPVTDAPPSGPPPIPGAAPPRAVPPPIPSQPPQSPPPLDKRRSMDVPRAAPPPPPPGKEPSYEDEEYDPFNYASPQIGVGGFSQRTPKIEEEPQFPSTPGLPSPPPQSRPPPPAPPGNRSSTRQSLDIPRASTTIRRSMDAHRPSIESGFIANDIDLAAHSGWWRQPNQVPPVLQGRRDLYFESEEQTTTQGSNTIVTRTIYILFQDYSQTVLTVVFDPYDQSDVELDQRHEPPPRQLRQDELEQAYERFGRAISSAVTSKKDSVVADGTPQSLVHELLRPFKDALAPIGTRAYGALVYANLANASTQQNDEIRPGDIVSIRNAKFQGKHGAMHAKYTAEVGKPDHVGVVAEWDGTKKKVRAWEQGRENKKVKMESFKLDDLRSGEVKVWRVMPRSWVGWNSQP